VEVAPTPHPPTKNEKIGGPFNTTICKAKVTSTSAFGYPLDNY